MTKDELLVIAAAAALFVLINIIMWSIIAAKEKKAKRQTSPPLSAQPPEQQAFSGAFRGYPDTVRSDTPGGRIDPPAFNYEGDSMTEVLGSPDGAAPTSKRSSFIILDNIVIVHTDETI